MRAAADRTAVPDRHLPPARLKLLRVTPESSPFRPGQPVPAKLFVGRLDAIERLRGLVRAADRGVFKIGFITGERGIGKSSLASFVRRLCERDGDVTAVTSTRGGAAKGAQTS